ncbi:hypothetical protein DBV05_g8725 [Lasiodiplodia theobromae]|uniref:Uncharacterized protein n=1 Tax=Lasiodiplodia theobromae TaxID=45133 RepID=A0A5N5D5K4_9PEZI|nr:hypothetical protein DBV05_g8725 [Lasiodiplodia theobromae]
MNTMHTMNAMSFSADATRRRVDAVWKQPADAERQRTEYIPLESARQFFAVDASGSTAGAIIAREHEFVKRLTEGHPNDQAATWGTHCNDPTTDFSQISWSADQGGTEPSRILKNQRALDTILGSDVWYLLTDGEIWNNDVQVLCNLAIDTGVLNVPTIFVITGSKRQSPSDLNVSVGISFFANAQDVLVLFKDTSSGLLYLIAAKGCFAPLDPNHSDGAPDLSSWAPLKEIYDEAKLVDLLRAADIKVPAARTRPSPTPGSVSLGAEWERHNPGLLVNLDLLLSGGGQLSYDNLEQLLAEEALGKLALAFKTRGRLQDLRTFLSWQKTDQQMNITLVDISGAHKLVAQLSQPDLDDKTRNTLQVELREAHERNRRHYQAQVWKYKESGDAQKAHNRHRLLSHALEYLAQMENSGYTADILARRSNRARRAQMVSDSSEMSLQSLDLETPNVFRATCHVCCGENEIMSIAVKAGADSAANTDNFALDFPLAAGRFKSNKDLISSQLICFQCALAFQGKSIFNEQLAAVLPTVDCHGPNKKYISEQLHRALTGGLRVGASGTSQLFMTILAGTLRKKEWAGAGLSEESMDAETSVRRAMFRWALDNMLERTSCRETFNEQGEWVTYPKALAWAATDFREQQLDSWAVGYPVAGFMQLIQFGRHVNAFDAQTARDLRLAKVLHSVASAYLALLYKNMHSGSQLWKQPLLALIYASFNADLIPLDQRGAASLLSDPAIFWQRLSAFLSADAELLANWDAASMDRAMGRVQLLLFWLVYTQRDHTRAKTFFHNLREDQPLAAAALDCRTRDPLSPSITLPTLLSIFRGPVTADPATLELRARHTGLAPFATPFGPSVLRCCFPACREPFLDATQMAEVERLARDDKPWPERVLDALRRGRAAHLVKVFATEEAFSKESQTGLPAVTSTPEPPRSTHCNLHVSVARVWAAVEDRERRKVIAEAVSAGGAGEVVDAFVADVRREICGSRRGDVFQEGLDGFVREILPSFVEAVGCAVRLERGDGDGDGMDVDGGEGQAEVKEVDVAAYEHDWSRNKLEAKARWELRRERAKAEEWECL